MRPDNPAYLSPLLSGLFPPGVTGAELRIAGDAASLFPDEARCVERAVPKRVEEFAAGRLCARRALAALGFSTTSLPANSDRSPQWPAAIVGSITHAADLCGVVVAARRQFRAIGLDVEVVGQVTADIWPYICTREENDWLDALPKSDQSRCAALLFSAKETFYKCQYGVTGQWLEFRDVAMEVVSVASNSGSFVLRPQRAIELLTQHSAPLAGHFQFDGAFVVTGMALSAVR